MTKRLALLLLVWLPVMAADETLIPDGTRSSDNNTSCDGTVHPTVDEDPAGGDWCTADNNNTSWVFIVDMEDPASALDTSADAQEIRFYVQSFDEGQSGDPTIQVNIYDSTTTPCDTLHESGSPVTLTDAGFPAEVSEYWTAAGLSAAADVCIQVDCTKSGGAPGARNSCNIDNVVWDATWAAGGRTRRTF
jgi:hypothetical protein